ncbi:MAG: prolipoprotein diacylglyceryl transferase [Planctomycetota bacterium]|jgi:phosphatidylglycerol:prolipoprotein diacylglycerol transferase
MYRYFGPIIAYSVFYSLAIVVHFVVGYLICRRLGLRRRVWIGLGISYLLGMTLGAKVLYDLLHHNFNLGALFTIQHYMKGGLWGGPLVYLALGLPVVLLLSKHKRPAVDLIVLTLPLPLILAKVGCLFHGCCYGRVCYLPWAIVFPVGGGAPAGVPRHPTQVYEMLLLVCILVVFRILKSERWRGTMLLWFLAMYGLGRAFIEIWRGDLHDRFGIGPVSLSQLICVFVACISIVVLYLGRNRSVPIVPEAIVDEEQGNIHF